MSKRKHSVERRNGVRVEIWRSDDGTAILSSCACLGLPMKVHSQESCPWRLKQIANKA